MLTNFNSIALQVVGSETVTVRDVPSAVNTSSDQISGLVDARQVKELPLNGRQLRSVHAQSRTVNYTNQRSGKSTGTSNSSVGSMFSASGRRPQDNLFLLNGIEYTGASLINTTPGGTSGQLLGIDGIHEFNVVTDTYSASYGKRDGAQVSISTTGGTNAFHGSAYEFLRNSFFDGRNYFDSTRIPEFQRNNFGALGGPIRKDKLFLFANYEGYRQNLGESIVTLVPDSQARLGNVPNANTGVYAPTAFSPISAQLLNLWPAANGPEVTQPAGTLAVPTKVAGFIGSAPQHIREDFGTSRFDYNIDGADTFNTIYTIDDSWASLVRNFPTLRQREPSRTGSQLSGAACLLATPDQCGPCRLAAFYVLLLRLCAGRSTGACPQCPARCPDLRRGHLRFHCLKWRIIDHHRWCQRRSEQRHSA